MNYTAAIISKSKLAKVADLEKTLEDLTRKYTVAVEAKVKCQQEADATGATISLANRLVGGLASEKVRWGLACYCIRRHKTS